MKVYLAGPMRGFDQFNFPTFLQAATDLREKGDEVISPAEHDLESGFDPTLNTLDGFDLAGAMRWDLQQISHVDAVIVLPGWGGSEGTKKELRQARKFLIPIYEYEDFIKERNAREATA